MRRTIPFLALLPAIISPAGSLRGEDAASPDSSRDPDYTSEVAPIFNRYCTGCHNRNGAEGRLVLDSREAMEEGGRHGPVLAPGKSAASKLVLVLEGKERPSMPPRGRPRPSEVEIALLKAWIDAGARGPKEPISGARLPNVPWIKPRVPPRSPLQS